VPLRVGVSVRVRRGEERRGREEKRRGEKVYVCNENEPQELIEEMYMQR
jgi:hypothetical protein